MSNKNYNKDTNPNNSKAKEKSMDEVHEKGKADKMPATYKEVMFPNESVPKLPQQGGAE